MQRSATVLAIGGSDSSGGAGVQGDLIALSSSGVHGCSVVTCITSQNTEDIARIYPVPTEVIRSQAPVQHPGATQYHDQGASHARGHPRD